MEDDNAYEEGNGCVERGEGREDGCIEKGKDISIPSSLPFTLNYPIMHIEATNARCSHLIELNPHYHDVCSRTYVANTLDALSSGSITTLIYSLFTNNNNSSIFPLPCYISLLSCESLTDPLPT